MNIIKRVKLIINPCVFNHIVMNIQNYIFCLPDIQELLSMDIKAINET